MKVIVTGSLGHIGKPLTEELLQKGHAVTVISSKPEKQKDIARLGAVAAIGSVDDAAFLTETFTGADAIFVMVPPNYAETNQVAYYSRLANNYKEAIRAASISKVVHLSSYGADLDRGTGFILGAHYAENILNELQNVSITHLRPTFFYYNLLGFVDMIRHAGIIGSNYGGEDKLVMVAPADIAAAAAEELANPDPGIGIRYVNSDERTASEVAAILGAAIGKSGLQWLTFTNEQTLEAMEKSGVPAHVAANLAELGAAIHSGALRKDYDLHQPNEMGKVKLEDYAKEFAKAFSYQ